MMGIKIYELRATIALCRFLQEHGRSREARDLLFPLYSWFTEGFDTADLKDPKAVLDDLDHRPSSPNQRRASL
jgi:hypothetical protein